MDSPTTMEYSTIIHRTVRVYCQWSLTNGGGGGTRTLAPISEPIPLAGVPLHQLEYSSKYILIRLFISLHLLQLLFPFLSTSLPEILQTSSFRLRSTLQVSGSRGRIRTYNVAVKVRCVTITLHGYI